MHTHQGDDKVTTASPTGKAPRYALIFRTHFWDQFAQRQFDRAKARAKSSDVYVLADETRGKIKNIGADRVVGLTDGEILAAGFVAASEGSLQWYSGDVPLYMFYLKYPDYDYYVQMEYDVNIHVDLDRLVEKIGADHVDVVALTNLDSIEQWHWRSTCLGAYRPEELRHQIICLSAFSNRGLAVLYKSRMEQANQFKAGTLKEWPYCEGFIPSEATRQGLNVAELSQYGDVDAYDWWPPFVESDLGRLQGNAFVHPVLDPDRYVPSLFKRTEGLRWLLSPTSSLHRKLQRLGPLGYVRSLFSPPFTRQMRISLGKFTRNQEPSR